MENFENQKQEDQSREYVEAVPGPAIVISRESYIKMQKNSNAKQNQERLKRFKKFFQGIKNETQQPEEKERLF